MDRYHTMVLRGRVWGVSLHILFIAQKYSKAQEGQSDDYNFLLNLYKAKIVKVLITPKFISKREIFCRQNSLDYFKHIFNRLFPK